MLTIPQRLLSQPEVNVWHHSKEITILSKKVEADIRHKTNYIGRHAITFVESGEQTIESQNGEVLRLRKGDIGCLRKGLYSVTDLLTNQQPFHATIFFFDEVLLKGAHSGQDSGQSFVKAAATPVLQAFVNGSRSLHSAGGFDSQVAMMKLHELLHHIGRDESLAALATLIDDLHTPRNGSIIDVMEQHFSKSMTIADYAYLTGRSESTFRREFKLKFGYTPRKWLMHKRLHRAREILTNSGRPVGEAAYEVGYDNVSHFIREYQKLFGETPGERARSSLGI